MSEIKNEIKEVKKVNQLAFTRDDVLNYLSSTGLSSKLTTDQKKLFVMGCIAYGLNPIKKEIYCVPMWDSYSNKQTMSIVTSYNIILERAKTNSEYGGYKCQWYPSDDINQIPNFKDELAVRITLLDKHRNEIYTSAKIYAKEFVKDWDKSPTWKKMPMMMLEKCALVRCLRFYFPETIGGLPYIAEEAYYMNNNDVIDNLSAGKEPNYQNVEIVEEKIEDKNKEEILSREEAYEVYSFAFPHFKIQNPNFKKWHVKEMMADKVKTFNGIVDDEDKVSNLFNGFKKKYLGIFKDIVSGKENIEAIKYKYLELKGRKDDAEKQNLLPPLDNVLKTEEVLIDNETGEVVPISEVKKEEPKIEMTSDVKNILEETKDEDKSNEMTVDISWINDKYLK